MYEECPRAIRGLGEENRLLFCTYTSDIGLSNLIADCIGEDLFVGCSRVVTAGSLHCESYDDPTLQGVVFGADDQGRLLTWIS